MPMSAASGNALAQRTVSSAAADVEKRAVSVPVEMGDQMCVNLCHHIAFSKGKAFVARIHIDAEGEQNGAENGADDREGRV